MARHYVTIEEANEMLPELRHSFRLLFQLHLHVKALMADLEDVGFAPRSDIFDVIVEDADEDTLLARGQLRAVIDLMKDELDALRTIGCIVRDIESGGVSWYARHQHRGDILLSWRLGEPEIGFWIEVGTGRVQRRPLHELDEVNAIDDKPTSDAKGRGKGT